MVLRLAAFLFLIALAVPAQAQAQERRGTALVELFTSQGCASCPRANRLLGRLAEDADVLALTYSVDYWDYLGWRDTFAHAEFTQRQRNYATRLRARTLFTPQFVFDGAEVDSGSQEERVRELVEEHQQASLPIGTPHVVLRQRGRRGVVATVGSGHAGRVPADVWLVAYDPGPVYADIRGGENVGRRVTHYNLVLRIRRLGGWTGAPRTYEAGACRPACAVIVQRANGGAVLSVARRQPVVASAN